MKEQDIDKIFKERQNQLDKMPAEGVWDKLERKLEFEEENESKNAVKPSKNLQWLKAAAVILAITIPSLLLFNLFIKNQQSQLAEANTSAGADNKNVSSNLGNHNNEVIAYDSISNRSSNNKVARAEVDKTAVMKETILTSAIKKQPVKTTAALASKKVAEKVLETKANSELQTETEIETLADVEFDEGIAEEIVEEEKPSYSSIIEDNLEVDDNYDELANYSTIVKPATPPALKIENKAFGAKPLAEVEDFAAFDENIEEEPPYEEVIVTGNSIENDAKRTVGAVKAESAMQVPTAKPIMEQPLNSKDEDKSIVQSSSPKKLKTTASKKSRSREQAEAEYITEEIDGEIEIMDMAPKNAELMTNSRPYVDYGTTNTISPYLWLEQSYENEGNKMAIKQISDQKLKAKSFKLNSDYGGSLKIQSIEVSNLGTNLILKQNEGVETTYKLVHSLDNEAIFENNETAFPNQIVFKQLNNKRLNLSFIGIQNGNKLEETIPLEIH